MNKRRYEDPLPHELAALENAYGARHVREFSPLLKTAEGQALVERLSRDLRVQALARHIVWRGMGGGEFSINFLAMWFLWLTKRRGEKDAARALEDFLNRPTSRVLLTQWLFGLEAEQPVDLGEGVSIRPASTMPESADREEFHDARMGKALTIVHPKCALVCESDTRKTVAPGQPTWPEAEIKTRLRRLGVLPLLLNAFEGVSCVPGLQTAYPDESTPFGPFSGGGGGTAAYDVIGPDLTKLP